VLHSISVNGRARRITMDHSFRVQHDVANRLIRRRSKRAREWPEGMRFAPELSPIGKGPSS
jgi:hypothetical protein